jgi:hypothetical protein
MIGEMEVSVIRESSTEFTQTNSVPAVQPAGPIRRLGKWTAAHRTGVGIALASILIQISIAPWFGHAFDDVVFLAAGYLVGTGQNPYQTHDLSAVFGSAAFGRVGPFAYPPPWALVLGGLDRIAGGAGSTWFAYQLAIKLPVIAANITIACLAVEILRRLGAEEKARRNALVFLLLNPFLFYFGTAWGQFDSIVTGLILGAILLLVDGKPAGCGWLSALAVSFKPTAIPILPVFWIYWWSRRPATAFRFLGACIAGGFFFCIAPFLVFGWNPAQIVAGWDYQFTAAGGMGLGAVYAALQGTSRLAGGFQVLGWLWLPVVALGAWTVRNRIHSLEDVLRGCLGLALLFFLSRNWLSEPNFILLIPLTVVLSEAGYLSRGAAAALWIVPFIFTLWNNSAPQMLFPILRDSLPALMQPIPSLQILQTVVQLVVIAAWQITGWRTAGGCLAGPMQKEVDRGSAPAAV